MNILTPDNIKIILITSYFSPFLILPPLHKKASFD